MATCEITLSLAYAPRQNLETWAENLETHARNMCPAHDIMGALTPVVPDRTWESIPGNLTNPIDVAAGQAVVYRNRPDWSMPAAHTGNAASGAVNLHRMQMLKCNDFCLASSTLNTALLANIGDVNQPKHPPNDISSPQAEHANSAPDCDHHDGPTWRSER